MIVQHNLPAISTCNRMRYNKTQIDKTLERLSSGLRINRARDDAAGLAISEKMRAMIRGLDMASRNADDGISLINVGEGALQEVHQMLQRLNELAVQSANGVYDDQVDRAALQKELDSVLTEIDRIASSTTFNGIPLFQNLGREYENTTGLPSIVDQPVKDDAPPTEEAAGQEQESRSVADIIANTGEDEVNIFYTKAELDYTVTSAAQGDGTDHSLDPQGVATALESEIVPNVVQQMLSMYPAFKYMGSANIGIGLKLYSDASTNVAASVSSGTSYSKAGDGSLSSYVQTYTLSVNMAKVGNLTNAEDRAQLESTIAHEMTHAFMFESMTNGMLVSPKSDRFPLWFVEGTAQTAGGGLDWVKNGLGITGTPTEDKIKKALNEHPLTNARDSAAVYGAGYLATLYLGFVAGGGDPTDNLEMRCV